MCGFIGAFGLDASKFEKGVRNGSSAIKHRGPDATDFYNDDSFSVGFNRLKIIDLSDKANQPFEDDEFVLVFNGEIYNFLELKKCFNFKTETTSDTEILFNILRKFKNNIKAGINLLNGMFAFAFYDKKNKKLILGRDRLGVKPLYYLMKDNAIFFGSEIKGLKNFSNVLKINHKSVINFIINRTVDYNQETFFDGIYQVRPATFTELRLSGKILLKNEIKYWDVAAIKKSEILDENKILEKFKELFFDAVSLRLNADVPVAILLSGGIDSSSIASAAAVLKPEKEITTISAVYKNDLQDEKKFAVKVSEKYKNLKSLWIEIEKEEFFNVLNMVIYHEEMPIADGSMVAHFLLMQKIKENNIKVVLSGQGGDEILGGYIHTFLSAYEADKFRKFQFANFNLRTVFHSLPAGFKNLLKKIWIYKDNGKFFKDKKVLSLVDNFYTYFNHQNILNSYLINSLLYWSLPGFLHYEDNNSMAFSIEARNPFLDYRLVEFMLSLPNDFKIKDGVGKWILRESLKDILPKEIIKRKEKQGFYAPIDKWGKNIPLDFLKDADFRRDFNYINFDNIIKSSKMKWRIYTLWIWYKEMII